MRKVQAGFTIIEVLIVVVIMGVLASLVLPSIRENAARAKVSEALLAFATCKNAVAEVYVGTVTTTDEGIIKVAISGTHDLRLDTFDITLEPLDASGNLMSDGAGAVRRWRCGRAGPGLTTLNPKYLPSSCRGI